MPGAPGGDVACPLPGLAFAPTEPPRPAESRPRRRRRSSCLHRARRAASGHFARSVQSHAGYPNRWRRPRSSSPFDPSITRPPGDPGSTAFGLSGTSTLNTQMTDAAQLTPLRRVDARFLLPAFPRTAIVMQEAWLVGLQEAGIEILQPVGGGTPDLVVAPASMRDAA